MVLKLVYFNIAGRAECTRLAFVVGGQEFEDLRLSREDWTGTWKAKSPTGQAPFLVLDDGRIIAQSIATQVFAAQTGGLYPSDQVDQAKTLELMACLEDATQVLGPTMRIQDPDEKIAERKKLLAPDGALFGKLKVIEDLLAQSSTEFYLGKEVSLADLVVFCAVSQFNSGIIDGLDADVTKQFPKMKELRDAVAAHPKVKEYYAGREGEGIYKAYQP